MFIAEFVSQLSILIDYYIPGDALKNQDIWNKEKKGNAVRFFELESLPDNDLID